MAAIITEKFRLHNAQQFFESFNETGDGLSSSLDSTYYFFIGKNTSFIDADNYNVANTVSDAVPPVPQDDVTSEMYIWDSMIAAKRITSADVTFAIPRRNWANDTLYDMYEHDIRPASGLDTVGNSTSTGADSLWFSNYVFMTSEYKVYKVLDNNGGANYNGTEPTSESTEPFLSDGGYFLKYMYTLSVEQIDKFLTSDFIPVPSSGTANPVDGRIHVVRVTGGSGYTDGTYYTPINGDGKGGIVKIVVSGGTIQPFGSGATKTEVLGNGVLTPVLENNTGYTFAYIDLTDVYTDSALTTPGNMDVNVSGADGKIEAIISPRDGHGANLAEELGAHFVMMNVKMTQAEGDDFTIANDFRQLGIVVNPNNWGTTTNATDSTRRQTYAIKFEQAPSTDFILDEKITQSVTGAVGRVVDWDSTNNILYYVQERHPEYGVDSTNNYVAFSGANLVTGALSNAFETPSITASETITLTGGNDIVFTSGYCNPELNPDTGKIVYFENRRPISRAADQTEDIKITIEF